MTTYNYKAIYGNKWESKEVLFSLSLDDDKNVFSFNPNPQIFSLVNLMNSSSVNVYCMLLLPI